MAHFLGTVVAYEALHVHLDLHGYLLVTLRSPLALFGAVRKMVTTVIASVARRPGLASARPPGTRLSCQ